MSSSAWMHGSCFVCLFVAAKPGHLLLLSSLFALAFGTSQALNNGRSGGRKEESNSTSDKCTSFGAWVLLLRNGRKASSIHCEFAKLQNCSAAARGKGRLADRLIDWSCRGRGRVRVGETRTDEGTTIFFPKGKM